MNRNLLGSTSPGSVVQVSYTPCTSIINTVEGVLYVYSPSGMPETARIGSPPVPDCVVHGYSQPEPIHSHGRAVTVKTWPVPEWAQHAIDRAIKKERKRSAST